MSDSSRIPVMVANIIPRITASKRDRDASIDRGYHSTFIQGRAGRRSRAGRDSSQGDHENRPVDIFESNGAVY